MRPTPSLLAHLSPPKSSPRHPTYPPFTLTLTHFLLRQRTTALYRSIIRTCRKIPDATTRDELKVYARGEFERHRHESDVGQIRFLLSMGKAEYGRVRGQMRLEG